MDPATEQLHDEWLVLRCQAGEPNAFAELVGRFEPGMLYYAAKLLGNEQTALDVMQEVWMRALRTIQKVREPGAARAWLYRNVHGACIDAMRRGAARRRAETIAAEMVDEVSEDFDAAFDADDAARIHAALDQVSERHREVLVLHFLESFSESQIASIIDAPQGTVKSRLHHAKKAMRHLLEKKE